MDNSSSEVGKRRGGKVIFRDVKILLSLGVASVGVGSCHHFRCELIEEEVLSVRRPFKGSIVGGWSYAIGNCCLKHSISVAGSC